MRGQTLSARTRTPSRSPHALSFQPSQEAVLKQRMRSFGRKHSDGWRAHSKKVRAALGLSGDDAGGWCAQNTVRGLHATERVTDLLNVAVEATMKERASNGNSDLQNDDDPVDLIIDVSQDVLRKPWCTQMCRSLTTSSELVSTQRKRAILPAEHLKLLGFAGCSLEDVTPAQIRELAGECMAPPCVGTIMAVAMLVLAGEQ